jgi:hypothetical protein
MKSILSEDEFKKMIGHLCETLDVEKKLKEGWEFKRDFSGNKTRGATAE